MNLQKLAIATVVIILIMISALLVSCLSSGPTSYPERGKYIYDDGSRMETEAELMISSYLLNIDRRTGYEVVLVFPSTRLSEADMINWFNANGVGKKEKDNGAALFVMPDNSWFMAIGAGNDKVSVPYSKTYGERTLKNLDDDFTLSILRFVDTIGNKIDEPTPTEFAGNIGKAVLNNFDIIILWTLLLALIVFLFKQRDGFQSDDLIIPIALLISLGVFFGLAFALSSSTETVPGSYTDYGLIISSKTDSRDYVIMVPMRVGKSTVMVPQYHTEYTNDVMIISYELSRYGYRFSTTDYRGAWYHTPGELDRLRIRSSDSRLESAENFKAFSGGKTIGDGTWGGQRLS
jgi:uncharacterized membrane protein YgcG